MTNSEAIKEIKHQVYKNTNDYEFKISKDCYKTIIKALEENDKLKFLNFFSDDIINELQQSKQEIFDKWIILNDDNIKLKAEIEILKEEVEQLKEVKNKYGLLLEMYDKKQKEIELLKAELNVLNGYDFKNTLFGMDFEEILEFKKEIEQLSNINNSLVKQNDKQNKEIEQLKAELVDEKVKRAELIDDLFENNEKLDMVLADNEELKAELENSVKLPCNIGDNVYFRVNGRNQFGEYVDFIQTQNISKIDIQETGVLYATASEKFIYTDIGKTIFLTREEAEQALKGELK